MAPTFTFAPTPGPACGSHLDFAKLSSADYENGQNTDEEWSLSDGGCNVTFAGNTWLAFELDSTYTVAEHSYLDFCFSQTTECEIYAIAPVEDAADLTSTADINFVVSGSQTGLGTSWDLTYDDKYEGGLKCYSIPLVDYYDVGTTFEYLAFVNDCRRRRRSLRLDARRGSAVDAR